MNMQSLEHKIQVIPKLISDIYSNDKFIKLISDIVNSAKTSEELPEFIFSGVGKNWYVCEKATKTFLSMGLKAHALDCTHALHGDLGLLEGDTKKILFFISKSGTTEEMVKLAKTIKYLKDLGYVKNIKVFGLFMEKKASDQEGILYDSVISPNSTDIAKLEFDDRNLIPSISINVTQTILDLFGILIYQAYPNLIENYKYNHMAGNNGKKLGSNSILESI